ncbi:hypothetical protein KSP40_PGU007853 [Platanthera guangdongensis]|uniref:Uncharacterized protein n=1 Tax=Platanthera guangdongensis TaxID=2320717 RepID=A0ABR2MJY9_9ASPA
MQDSARDALRVLAVGFSSQSTIATLLRIFPLPSAARVHEFFTADATKDTTGGQSNVGGRSNVARSSARRPNCLEEDEFGLSLDYFYMVLLSLDRLLEFVFSCSIFLAVSLATSSISCFASSSRYHIACSTFVLAISLAMRPTIFAASF